MFFAIVRSPALLAFVIVYSTFTQSAGSLSGNLQQHGSGLLLRGPPSDLVPNPSEPTPPPLPPPPTKVSDYYGPHLVSRTVGYESPTPLTPVFSPSATTGTTTNLPSWALLPTILVLLGIFGIGVAYVRLFDGRRSSQQRTSFGITVSFPSSLSRIFTVVSRFLVRVVTIVCFVYGAGQIVSDVTGLPSPSTLLRIALSKLSLGVNHESPMKIAVRFTDLNDYARSINGLYKVFAAATNSVFSEIPQWYQHRIIPRGVFTLSTVKVIGGRLEFGTLDMSDVLVLGRAACGVSCLIASVAISFASKSIVTSILSNKPLGIIQHFWKCFEAMASPRREVLRSIFTLLPSSIELNFMVPFIIHEVNLLLNAAMTVAIPVTACRQLLTIPRTGNLLSVLSLAIFVMECAFAAFKDKCGSFYERLSRRLRTSIASVKATRIVDTSIFPPFSESVNESCIETSEDDSVFNTVPDSVDVISPKKAFNLRINTGFVFTPTAQDSDSTGSPTTSTLSAASSYFETSSASLNGEITPATSIPDSCLLLPMAKESEPAFPVATSTQCEEASEQSTEDKILILPMAKEGELSLPPAASTQCDEDIEQSTADIDTLPTGTMDTSSSISATKTDDSYPRAAITVTAQRQETPKQPTGEWHARCSASAPLIAQVEDDGEGAWTVVEPKRCKRRYRNKIPSGDPSVAERLNRAPPTHSNSSSSEEPSVSTLMPTSRNSPCDLRTT